MKNSKEGSFRFLYYIPVMILVLILGYSAVSHFINNKSELSIDANSSDAVFSIFAATESGQGNDDENIKISPNNASVEELCLLPGIGEKIANAIIEDRQSNGLYHVAEDLLGVNGIGEKKLEGIRPYLIFP